MITRTGKISRRNALKLATASATLPLVHIRSGRAAGKLSVGFWDHWVPEGNEIMKQQCAAFAAAHQVDMQVDFITSVGSKNLLTIAAEAQAKTGHDIQQLPGWEVQNHADQLEPVDDIMQRLTAKYGNVAASSEYLVQNQEPLAGSAMQFGQSEQGTMRPHLRPQGRRRIGRREDVPAVRRPHARSKPLDLRHDA